MAQFDSWKYLVLGAITTICVCFSISYGLAQINTSVRNINSGVRDGIDSVKIMQKDRSYKAEQHFDSISRQLNRIENQTKK